METDRSDCNRRQFVRTVTGGLLGAGLSSSCRSWSHPAGQPKSVFDTRGVVLLSEDLTLEDWPERASRAGLTTIALHHQYSPRAVVDAVHSDGGRTFLETCRELGLEIEYELHAMKELLPRELFSKDPSLFRMDDHGQRTPDANLCVHSSDALEVVAEHAVALAESLRPTTSRYFLWGDDGASWCRCARCRDLLDSDQALILENHLWKVLHELDEDAQLAHLAYGNTLPAPAYLKPERGVFLEYAPIRRRYDIPYTAQIGMSDGLEMLDANLKVFRPESAQVLEYWLDVSRFSNWKRPATRLPWDREVFFRDLEAYSSRGIRHVTSFAAWVDADYVQRFGEPTFLGEYGAGLLGRARR